MAKHYALVTGASKGIGRAVSYALAKEGYPLILIAHTDAEGLEATAAQCRELLRTAASGGGKLPADSGAATQKTDAAGNAFVHTFLCDLSDPDAVRRLFADLSARGIGHRLNHPDTIGVLVNNAGIAHFALVQDMSDEDWRRVTGANLDSVFYTCRAVVPMMVYEQSGVIVNISSYWGEKGAAFESAYAASKGGVNAFTRSLAEELSPSHIRVHVVSPEFVDTEMNAHLTEAERADAIAAMPSGRAFTADEIAAKVMKLIAGNQNL
ncbi:MAG: SDR family NAD(P)-dependent oxidoreductase [Lachnospiraceae bacterium]|nr:SDR family NAD(P)-dependent oxidoreductase [Lachnospiraceae bacterium]